MIARCMKCRTAEGQLTVVALDAGNSGPGWAYRLCRTCLVAERLIPFAQHPPSTRGAPLTYPALVPDEIVARLAHLGSRAEPAPTVARLLAAARCLESHLTSPDDHATARRQARLAVAELRAASTPHLNSTRKAGH